MVARSFCVEGVGGFFQNDEQACSFQFRGFERLFETLRNNKPQVACTIAKTA